MDPLVQLQPATIQLDEHLLAELAGAGAAVVDDAGGRHGEDAPALIAYPPAPVHFLAVHEVVLVEQPGLIDRRPADHHARTKGMIDFERLAAAGREATIERAVENTGRRWAKIEERLEQSRKAEGAVLVRAVGI